MRRIQTFQILVFHKDCWVSEFSSDTNLTVIFYYWAAKRETRSSFVKEKNQQKIDMPWGCLITDLVQMPVVFSKEKHGVGLFHILSKQEALSEMKGTIELLTSVKYVANKEQRQYRWKSIQKNIEKPSRWRTEKRAIERLHWMDFINQTVLLRPRQPKLYL